MMVKTLNLFTILTQVNPKPSPNQLVSPTPPPFQQPYPPPKTLIQSLSQVPTRDFLSVRISLSPALLPPQTSAAVSCTRRSFPLQCRCAVLSPFTLLVLVFMGSAALLHHFFFLNLMVVLPPLLHCSCW